MWGNSDHWGRWHRHWTLLLTSWLRTVRVTQWNAGFHFHLVGVEKGSEETGCWVLRRGLHISLSLCTKPVYLPFSPPGIQMERWSILLGIIVGKWQSHRVTAELPIPCSCHQIWLPLLSEPFVRQRREVFPFNILEECISIPSSYLNHSSYFSSLMGNILII